MDDPRLERLKTIFQERGWKWRIGKPIPYGIQLLINAGGEEASLDFYPKRGKTVIGGANGPLRQALTTLTSTDAPAAQSPRPTAAASVMSIQGAHIGMDESGKGDWFGPLVVAAVYLEPEQATLLQQAGVRDSKQLSLPALSRLRQLIEQHVAVPLRHVKILDPLEYNRRYAGLNNINLLLAELYSEAAEPVQQASRSERIVCDQFAQRADRLEQAFRKAGLPRPTQLHHAESASVAVAAASILATTSFDQELRRLGAQAGFGRSLPRGASALADLRAAAQQLIAQGGAENLARYAKLNFKPVQELLGR